MNEESEDDRISRLEDQIKSLSKEQEAQKKEIADVNDFVKEIPESVEKVIKSVQDVKNILDEFKQDFTEWHSQNSIANTQIKEVFKETYKGVEKRLENIKEAQKKICSPRLKDYQGLIGIKDKV